MSLFKEKIACIDLINETAPQEKVVVAGWVRTKRVSKSFSFIELNDGSCLPNIQIIIDKETSGVELLSDIQTGATIHVIGSLVKSLGQGQLWEIHASDLYLLGHCEDDYPLQKKRHSDEFLREIAHLRPRTNKYSAIARIRSTLSFAVHDFFRTEGFHLVNTPIITGSDCEGAGEMFQVTTLDPTNAENIYSSDFFGKKAHLTVSGQLALETYCMALSKVYTFGPTFRSENSNTARHMAEFWMVEPEMAFANIFDDMDIAEKFVKSVVSAAKIQSKTDLNLFVQYVDQGLLERLDNILESDFARITYTEAIEILRESNKEFSFTPAWGKDLQTEHERYLTEFHFKKPVFVYDWPINIKAFYMRKNDDNKTVAAMDLLVPIIGELVGGSAREERLDILLTSMRDKGFNEKDYWWYLDTRKNGTTPHAGFGLGFERLIMLVTGVSNIRDVIPFPRTPKSLEF
jgi:asparaginyl-tRNA synthetase